MNSWTSLTTLLSATCFTYKTSSPAGSVHGRLFSWPICTMCTHLEKVQVKCCEFHFIFNKMLLFQEQLEHAEVSTALRYLGQYYFKNKLYDEASLCAQRCCDYNDVSTPAFSYRRLMRRHGNGANCHSVRRLGKRGKPCWGRSRRLEIKLKHRPQICLHRSPTTTLQSGGCLHSTSSRLHPDIHLFLFICCKMDSCLHHVT